jgi:catechol 2,3-dioxygenase-like lactoylglutathione lyase family enzyme
VGALGLEGPVQVAYSVSNVHDAAVSWTLRFGAGPFIIREHIELRIARVNGSNGVFDHSSAYGQWGDVMVELVQQHTPPLGAEVGLHHCAYFVDDLGATQRRLTEAGFPEVLYAEVSPTGTAFAFHDARTELGHLIEIYEGAPGLRSFYAPAD